MIINKPQWIKIYHHFVNINQITHINMEIYGCDCGAPFEQQDEKFLTITLACGQNYRVRHKDPGASELLEKLGFNLN